MSETRYAKIINEETHEVEVGVGCLDEYYMEVEQAYNSLWYVAGYAPVQPEPTIDEKKAAVCAVRDSYINGIEWRVSRYRDQKELEIETTDDAETYHKVLEYMQYLRDYPESTETWYEQNPMTWDEWKQK